MSAFVISKRFDGSYKFKFASRKGKTIFTSIACRQKSDCELIIATLKNNISAFVFTQKRTGSGKHFFRISKNGLVLASSRKFSTEPMLSKGIDQIMKYVPAAEVLDFSEDDAVFAEADSDPVSEQQK